MPFKAGIYPRHKALREAIACMWIGDCLPWINEAKTQTFISTVHHQANTSGYTIRLVRESKNNPLFYIVRVR